VNSRPQRVAVLGASNHPERYAFRAIELLRQHGHIVLPVTPKDIDLPGLSVYPDLRHTPPPIDTLTLYVNPTVVESLGDEILAARPGRVIFNPGTEHPEMAKRFQAAGIKTVEACTLVLLGTGQFD
jgi:predicted CoA-binding protein